MAKNIALIPENDRPYEKLEKLGSENLTNSELLSIIIKSGTKDKNCLDLSREILGSNNDYYIDELEYLSMLSINELTKFRGIGKKKAVQIRACIELSKRIYSKVLEKKNKISCPKDAYSVVRNFYFGKMTETVCVISLDNRCNVLGINKVSSGLTNSVNLGVKEVFSDPIKNMASSIILVHNHPSGSLIPSKQDIVFSKNMMQYGETFKIRVEDHIIIAKDEYISMKEKGYI